jgi:hypothetical protein
MARVIRIGNASGYWGDDPEALARQVLGGDLDYVTLDFLAEITMVILQRQRARDASLGYAYDFVRMLEPVLGEAVRRGVRIVANAGGINVGACADRVADLCQSQGLDIGLGVVGGDDLLPRLGEILASGVPLTNMDDGRPLRDVHDEVVSANAYLGAWPIAAALAAGAHVVVTGRTTDAALTLGPLVHEHGWAGTSRRMSSASTRHIWRLRTRCRRPSAGRHRAVGRPFAEVPAADSRSRRSGHPNRRV